jgi:hypothetical protein
MNTMLMISFNYSCSQEELAGLALEFATEIRPRVAGLEWKIYLNDPTHCRSAGLYLFRDHQSANAYLNSAYVQQLSSASIVSDLSAEMFQTMHEPSIRSGAQLTPHIKNDAAI